MQNPKENRKRRRIVKYVVDEPKPKHRPYDAIAQAEDEQLTKILFGSAKNFVESLEQADHEYDQTEIDSENESLTRNELNSENESHLGNEFDSDNQSHSEDELHSENDDDSENSDSEDGLIPCAKPVWTDDEDEQIEVGEALEAQSRALPEGGINRRTNKYKDLLEHKFKFINGTPKWSDLNKAPKDDDDDDDDALLTCGFIKKIQPTDLPASVVNYKKMRDLNCQTYNEGPFINCVKFFNHTNVAVVAGQAGIASFSLVDGKKNRKLQSVQFESFPIFSAELLADDTEVIFGSRHSHIYSYDIPSGKTKKINLPPNVTTFKKCAVTRDQKLIAVLGKWGEIHLLSAKSKERIGVLKQSSEATALAFSPNDKYLFVHSDTGEVTIFNVFTRRVMHKFKDEGCLQGTSIGLSSSNQFLASGSAQGIVNLYDTDTLFQNANPIPRKTIMNITTGITSLAFNPTSEMLAFSSVDCTNSVKLYHINSSTVFKNFPSFETKLGHVNALDFSPSSGYLGLGNKSSTVSLYRISHYKDY